MNEGSGGGKKNVCAQERERESDQGGEEKRRGRKGIKKLRGACERIDEPRIIP